MATNAQRVVDQLGHLVTDSTADVKQLVDVRDA
jgi:hypothetical protein